MEENVVRELEHLKAMVLNWKKSYLSWIVPGGENEYIAHEFSEEISRHVSPYVQKLFEFKHLTPIEAKEFLDFCYGQVEDLRNALEEPEEKDEKGFWHMLAED